MCSSDLLSGPPRPLGPAPLGGGDLPVVGPSPLTALGLIEVSAHLAMQLLSAPMGIIIGTLVRCEGVEYELVSVFVLVVVRDSMLL